MSKAQEYLYAGRTNVVKEYNPETSVFSKISAPRVVEFYSPHCPACIAFSSLYIIMAENTQKIYPEIEFFGVSCVKYEQLCDQYDIQGYPTLRFFKEDDGPTSMGVEREFESEDAQDVGSPKKIADLLNANSIAVTNVRKQSSENQKDDEEYRGIENTSKFVNNDKASKHEETSKQAKSKKLNDGKRNYEHSNFLRDEARNEQDDNESSNDENKDGFGKSIRYSPLYKVAKEKHLKSLRGSGMYFWKYKTNDRQGSSVEHAPYDEMTKGMKQNTPGTIEFRDRREAFRKRIEKSRRKHKLQDTKHDVEKENLPFTKDVTKPKWFETKMSEEEELILDTTLSLTVALETGLSMGITDNKSKAAMKEWLNLLSVSLPPEWNIHKLIEYLKTNFEYATKSKQNFKDMLKSHPLVRKRWSASCQNKLLKSEGFSCGFWKLLHLITLGIAEQRGGQNLIDSGMMVPTTVVFSPALAADTIRNYIDKFFTCRQCREHFLATYDNCNNNRRCERLTGDLNTENPSDWKELSLWLWEVHNDVSVRLVQERISHTYTKGVKNAPTLEDEMSVLVPNINNCVVCFENNGTWNTAEVFQFLERFYWPDSETDPLTDTLLTFDSEVRSGAGFLWLSMFLVLWLVYKATGKQSYSIHQALVAAQQIVSQYGTTKSRTV